MNALRNALRNLGKVLLFISKMSSLLVLCWITNTLINGTLTIMLFYAGSGVIFGLMYRLTMYQWDDEGVDSSRKLRVILWLIHHIISFGIALLTIFHANNIRSVWQIIFTVIATAIYTILAPWLVAPYVSRWFDRYDRWRDEKSTKRQLRRSEQ